MGLDLNQLVFPAQTQTTRGLAATVAHTTLILNRHIKSNCKQPQFSIEDLRIFWDRKAEAKPVLNTVFAHCRSPHSVIVRVQSCYWPHPDPCYNFGFLLSWHVLLKAFGWGGVVQHDGTDDWFFTWNDPIYDSWCPTILMMFFAYSAYGCTTRRILV